MICNIPWSSSVTLCSARILATSVSINAAGLKHPMKYGYVTLLNTFIEVWYYFTILHDQTSTQSSGLREPYSQTARQLSLRLFYKHAWVHDNDE